MADAPRALRCPLCCETIVCSSEKECEAHIASCGAFHSEFGAQSRRNGLVSGFQEATQKAVASERSVVPDASALESACDAYAALLAPVIPVAREAKSVEDLSLIHI